GNPRDRRPPESSGPPAANFRTGAGDGGMSRRAGVASGPSQAYAGETRRIGALPSPPGREPPVIAGVRQYLAGRPRVAASSPARRGPENVPLPEAASEDRPGEDGMYSGRCAGVDIPWVHFAPRPDAGVRKGLVEPRGQPGPTGKIEQNRYQPDGRRWEAP